MVILRLFSRKTANRSEAKNPRGTQSSLRARRGTSLDAVRLMDRVGSFEVSE